MAIVMTPGIATIMRVTLSIILICGFLLIFVAGFNTPAQAQTDPEAHESSEQQYSPPGKQKKRESGENDNALTQEIQVKIPIKSVEMNSCQAEVHLQYHQRNTLARVETAIDQTSCKTATGEYSLRITIQDDNGDYENLEFDERWQQEGPGTVKSARDYPIGENVTLKRVMVRSVHCDCTELQAKPADN
jgi:hypothetical protein